MEFKRGDTTNHRLTIPIELHEGGMKIYFMAKPAMDDDGSDSAAVISKKFVDDDIVERTEEKITYLLRFKPADTDGIMMHGENKKVLWGEFEFRYKNGDVRTYPEKGCPLKVTIWSDVRRGNG